MAKPLVLRIPRRLESPNVWNGRHWRVKHRISQEWEQEVWAQVSSLTGEAACRVASVRQLRPSHPKRARVSIERQVPSRRNFIRDDDNLRFAVKPLLDALKRQGYMYDDSRTWLDHPTPTQSVSADGKDWTIITLGPAHEQAA